MGIEQVFVGTVAFLLGALYAAIALFDLAWFFRLPKARWAETRWGHRTARLGYGVIGLILIVLGLYIALRHVERPAEDAGALDLPNVATVAKTVGSYGRQDRGG